MSSYLNRTHQPQTKLLFTLGLRPHKCRRHYPYRIHCDLLTRIKSRLSNPIHLIHHLLFINSCRQSHICRRHPACCRRAGSFTLGCALTSSRSRSHRQLLQMRSLLTHHYRSWCPNPAIQDPMALVLMTISCWWISLVICYRSSQPLEPVSPLAWQQRQQISKAQNSGQVSGFDDSWLSLVPRAFAPWLVFVSSFIPSEPIKIILAF